MQKTLPAPRVPNLRDQLIDPATCEVMPGHQHLAGDVDELADSIVALGQINPVQILEYPDGRRLIAAGRRRWMACKSRGLQLRVDVWLCKANEDVNSENLARAMRIAENTERTDPSAIDVAYQLRRIRNENDFASAAELAASIGMSESRVKRYLCVLQASDHLLDTAQTNGLPIKTVAELMRCEKLLGARAARKYIKQAAEGTLTARELKKIRDKAKAPKSNTSRSATSVFAKKLEKSGKAFLTLLAQDPSSAGPYAEELIAKARMLLGDPDLRGPSSPG